ncbi:sulfurtransferase TusA family protein [Pontibacillus sp. HN14]|uniref:Sulfurtransferase TusA family protein n=2 Tax=Bacillaceae TaxID=186817 RepID=A0ABY8UTB4_9BACI|nr:MULTISPECIES: sulfurtransferase TusA family protein [Pontibacillus]MCD5322885.1 sulfurtransferase TusA family protein [Pontibacillus sp. HN14]WIF96282.1 sulfurtransferase TusA family protein [Pontibacillus chungwhensis]
MNMSTTVLDVKGMACPMPIIKTKKSIQELNSGDVLEVQTTDQGAVADLSAWAKSGGHEVVDHKEEDGVITFWIRKG